NKFLKVSFLAKVSHSATLKTRSFGANYADDLLFFDRVNDLLMFLGNNDYSFDYDNYYCDIMGAYESIVEGYYIDKKSTSLEMVRGMLKSDYKDLKFIYDLKLHHPHKIEDEEQYNFDELICAFFMQDNELLNKYSTGEIVDTDKHGQIHSERVGILSYLIGKLKDLSDEDIEILLLASKYHDIGRKIKDDKTHSVHSVKLLEKDKILEGSPIRDYVYFLVEAHGFGDKEDVNIMSKYKVNEQRALMLLGIFKDADALDRVRYDSVRNYGSILNIKYLRNTDSKKLLKFAYMLNAQYKQNKRELSQVVKKLLKN
ncbi:MAG: HD domain-containing protein, partial [Bacilli bacterium]|nr:HD domain-containing protein [Bacilli bacterium]